MQKLYERYCNHNVFIAGSFRQLKNNEERMYIEEIIDAIVRKLTDNNFNIYSGNGRGLGEIVVARVNKYSAENHFVNRPYIYTNDSDKQKHKKNTLILKDCDTMIVVCGQDDSLESSRNVFEQFLAFMNENRAFNLVIPIPSTGYAAKKIFESDVFRKSSFYLNHVETFDRLLQTSDAEIISNIVVNLIRTYKLTNS